MKFLLTLVLLGGVVSSSAAEEGGKKGAHRRTRSGVEALEESASGGGLSLLHERLKKEKKGRPGAVAIGGAQHSPSPLRRGFVVSTHDDDEGNKKAVAGATSPSALAGSMAEFVLNEGDGVGQCKSRLITFEFRSGSEPEDEDLSADEVLASAPELLEQLGKEKTTSTSILPLNANCLPFCDPKDDDSD